MDIDGSIESIFYLASVMGMIEVRPILRCAPFVEELVAWLDRSLR